MSDAEHGELTTAMRHTALAQALSSEATLLTGAACASYGYDNSACRAMPAAVVLAATHGDVVETVRYCRARHLPLTPRGAGSGTCGGAVPTDGGIVLSCERLCEVTAYSREDGVITVQAGLTNEALQRIVAADGWFWPPDPGSSTVCTVGGNIATNAAGPRALKYGATREHVLALVAVTGAGETIHTGVRTDKGNVGYDLTRLLVGSEGTLAIVTEATLRLSPKPPCVRTGRFVYESVAAAVAAVIRCRRAAVMPQAIEYLDAACLRLLRERTGGDIADGAAMLLVAVDGMSTTIATNADIVFAAAQQHGCVDARIAADDDESRLLWRSRKALSPALRELAPMRINEDVVVPPSQLPLLLDGVATIATDVGLPIVCFGHAGNGNIHVNILYDPAVATEAAHMAMQRLFALTLTLGGALSGEHGIGLTKRPFVVDAIPIATRLLMADIKRRFDPDGVLNRGKIFADE